MLLRKYTGVRQDDDDILQSYDRLSEEEVQKFQLKLARSLVVFMELLHILIARNRDLLLEVVQKRKQKSKQPRDTPYSSMHRVSSRGDTSSMQRVPSRGDSSSMHNFSGRSDTSIHKVSSRGDITLSISRTPSRSRSRRASSDNPRRLSFPIESTLSREDSSVKTKSSSEEYDPGTVASSKESVHDRSRADPMQRTDAAIGIQRELQLAFINIAKDLWPMVHGVMENDAPRWLKECCQDSYFSKYKYRRAKIPIGEELIFEDGSFDGKDGASIGVEKSHAVERFRSMSTYARSDKSYTSQAPDSPGGSIGSVASRGSADARSTKSLTSIRSQKERLIP